MHNIISIHFGMKLIDNYSWIFCPSGMDPAGPEFSGDLDNACRLDRSDALFVDAMHTDGEILIGGGAGLMDEVWLVKDFLKNNFVDKHLL